MFMTAFILISKPNSSLLYQDIKRGAQKEYENADDY